MYFLAALALLSALPYVTCWSAKGCSFTPNDEYKLQWAVSNAETIHFRIEYSNSYDNDSFWIGIGFSNVQKSRKYDVDLVAFVINNQTITAVVTRLQEGREIQFDDLSSDNITVLATADADIEDSHRYQFNFSRLLAPSRTFTSDLSDCSVWSLFVDAQPLTNASEDSLDFLICNLSEMCEEEKDQNEDGKYQVEVEQLNEEDGHENKHNETNENEQEQGSHAMNDEEQDEHANNEEEQNKHEMQEGNKDSHEKNAEEQDEHAKNGEEQDNHDEEEGEEHKNHHEQSNHGKSKRQILEVVPDEVVPAMYNPVVTPNSPDYLQVLEQNEIALALYTDESCSRPDPYWCSEYVDGFMEWQRQFNSATTYVACQQLIQSVQFADNRCCHSVKAAGCL